MAQTSLLRMPFIEAAQAQKHVTHNDALLILDAVTQLAAKARQATPPSNPQDGDRYLVKQGKAAWSGQNDALAVYQDGSWRFQTPREGWTIWIADDQNLLVRHQNQWQVLAALNQQN